MKAGAICASVLLIALSGCGVANKINNDLNSTAAEIMGTYSAPVLAGSPRPSGCGDDRCRRLDRVEERGYLLARQKKITWLQFVDAFYKERRNIYPDSNDGPRVFELISYQRALAEQMDIGKITEIQWTYLIDKKFAELGYR